MKKPDGTTVISRENYKSLVWGLPVGDLLFVGHSTLDKLKRIGIESVGDLARSKLEYVSKYLGKIGENLWFYANGEDKSPVLDSRNDGDIKSVGNSVTCYRDLTSEEDVAVMLSSLCESVSERLMRYDIGRAKSISVGIRDSKLNWYAKQEKLNRPSVLSDDFFTSAMKLFNEMFDWSDSIRSLSVTVFDFADGEQLDINVSDVEYMKRLNLMKTVGKIRDKYGAGSVRRGLSFKDRKLTKEGNGHGGSLPPAGK